MKILGIESSCDETAAAVVENGRTVKSNIIATSLEEVGSDMTRVSTQVREAADLQKNRELLGL